MKYNWNISKIKEIVPGCVNLTEVLEHLKIPRQGNNSSTLKRILDQNQIDYSHFTGRARNYAKANTTKIQDYLDNKVKITSCKLKEKLIKEGLKENRCEVCGITEWQGKLIVCQLHHKDGNNQNNNLDNLQILCPNCHSQTESYCGQANKDNTIYYCKDCGRKVNKGSVYCTVCSHKHSRKVQERPSKKQLLLDFKELKSFTQIGIKYGVSDNTIRKWFASAGLPNKSKELKAIV